nr:amino acid adenylation domain-containing protein [Actinomycetota bacterium]NIY08823.1 hypothetical protein [Gemmatimonadota bacterium]
MRIELGETEAALLRHAAVSECVVLASDDPRQPGNRQLVAYVVPDRERAAAEASE